MWAHTGYRMEVVRRMYQLRFSEKFDTRLTLQQIRGMVGVRVRDAYAQAAKETGVAWAGKAPGIAPRVFQCPPGADAHVAACPHDAQGDFFARRDQGLAKHRFSLTIFNFCDLSVKNYNSFEINKPSG
jgi:hypothetical protein